MIKNYLTTAIRNVIRHKGFSFMNIVGLSLSISVCMLILVVLLDQYSYDKFNTKGNEIYRVNTINNLSNIAIKKYATCPRPLGEDIFNNYTLTDDYVVLQNWFNGDAKFDESVFPISGVYASEHFFEMFDFPLEGISRVDALKEPFTIILQEDIANKFFGDLDPIGRYLLIEKYGEFKVVGVIPKYKFKSHIQFEALVSMSTTDLLAQEDKITDRSMDYSSFNSCYVYFQIKKGVQPKDFDAAFREISDEHCADNEDLDIEFVLQKLKKVTPGPIIANELGMAMPMVFVLFFAGLAIIIIISAAFNYTSLSIARSLMRAKEVAVRKTLGAQRKQIIWQFLTEAVVISLISSFFAFLLLQLLLPAFAGMKMMAMLKVNPEQNTIVYIWFLGFAIITGLISGILPSVFISAFNPIKILKGITNVKLFSRVGLRKVLLSAQFSFSIIFIITIILVYRQMNFMINAEMGFDQDIVFNLRLQGKNFDKIKNHYTTIPEIEEIAAVGHVPGIGWMDDMDIKLKPEDEDINIACFNIDHNYIDVMGLEIIAGSNVPDNNNGRFIVLNEKAVKQFNFGTPAEAIGQSIYYRDTILLEVVGVVKDYYYVALFIPSKSLILRNVNDYQVAAMRINSKNLPVTLEKLKSEWKKIDEIHEMEGMMLNEEIKDYYSYFEDIIYTVSFATILAIVIASLGLLGMATFSTQTKVKEIGVRKVYGAQTKTVMKLVSKSYIRLLIISSVIGGTLAYLINNSWINFLANHVNISFFNVFAGIVIVFIAGLATISYQTYRAANKNPAHSLRYE